MDICLHTNFEIGKNYIGGTERFLITISKELKSLGFNSFIVCSSMTEEIEVEGIKVIGIIPEKYKKKFKEYSFFSSAFLKNEIIGQNFNIDSLKRLSEYTNEQLINVKSDITHLNSFASATFLTPDKTYFVTNHENEKEYDGYWGDGFFEMMSNLIYKRETELHKYQKLITPSFYYSHQFSKVFDLPIQAINLGIRLEDFPINMKKNEPNQEKLSILLPSRLQTKQKGHDIALQACAILKRKGINFELICTGVKKSTEKYIPDLKKMIKEYKLEDRVKIKSFFNINEAYEECDIVISPEKYCSYGLSISESLSLGIPTILSDIPTYTEIANSFNNAYFFSSESAEDLANVILKVRSKNYKRDFIDAIKFRSKFDLRNCAKEYSKLYLQVLNNYI